MAYKAPLPMRIFQYLLWTVMLFVLVWFFLIPMFLRVTAPKPKLSPNLAPAVSSTSKPGLEPALPTQGSATSVVAP